MASKKPGEVTITMNPNWTIAQRAFFHRFNDALPVLMSYLDEEIPVLDNHTDAMLVDETGVLKQVKKTCEKAEKAHVERLKARMGDQDSSRGQAYEAVYRGSGRVILNQGACKELIEKADSLEVHLGRLLAAIESRQLDLPNNIFLQEATDEQPAETNVTDFFTSAAGGRSLYVEPIQ